MQQSISDVRTADGLSANGNRVLVKLCPGGSWEVKSLAELLSIKVAFKVISWTGELFRTADAYAYSGGVVTSETYRVKISGIPYDCAPGHPWLVLKRGRAELVDTALLKPGVLVIRHPGLVGTTFSTLKKFGTGVVSSVKRRSEPTLVGNLSVHNQGNFMLDTGCMTGSKRKQAE